MCSKRHCIWFTFAILLQLAPTLAPDLRASPTNDHSTSVKNRSSDSSPTDLFWDNTLSNVPDGTNGSVFALALYANQLIAAGSFTRINGVLANRIASWDGFAWQPLGEGLDGTVQALTVYNDKLIVGGRFSNAGQVVARNIVAWDGSGWSAVGAGISPYFCGPDFPPNECSIVEALTTYDGKLIAGGLFSLIGVPEISIAAWDGADWSAIGELPKRSPLGPCYSVVTALLVDRGNLYAGGTFQHHIVEWEDPAWVPVATGMFGYYVDTVPEGCSYLGSVRTLVRFGDVIIAGGLFRTSGGDSTNGIASWDGVEWSSLNSGFNADLYGYNWGSAHASTVVGHTLFVGGDFDTAGGVAVNRIAAWTGSDWIALGSGIEGIVSPYNNAVYALIEYEGTLVVGGSFSSAGGKLAGSIAQWTLLPGFCGDVDRNFQINLADAVSLINFLFRSDVNEPLMSSVDVTCDGRTNITDAVYLVNYIFSGGPAPCAACL